MEPENHLTLIINGKTVYLSNLSPTISLLTWLRQNGFVGTKEGCGDGDCGACTVALIGKDADGNPNYQAVNSCLIPVGSVAGRDIVTVEGLGKELLHPVQAAMVKTGGSQCGYCTPGFILSLFAAYYDGKVDDSCVEGNLCRCTGYLPIRRAAQRVAQADEPSVQLMGDRFRERLEQASTHLYELNYSGQGQRFYRPRHLADVLNLLQAHPKAALVAGATDLGLELSYHRKHFSVMISLEAVAELQTLTIAADGVEIGAAIPLSHIEHKLHGLFPSLDEMLYWFAARQVRNRATLGGNIGTASPIGDLPPVLLSLDAEIKLVSAVGERIMPLVQFFKGYRQTELQPGEVIVSVLIPRAIAPGAVRRFSQSYKVGKRGTDDISIVAAAFTIDLDRNDQIVQARLAYGGVAAIPIRAIAVEQMLVGKPWTITTIEQAKQAFKAVFNPLTDLRGSADYRKLLTANLFEKFFVECCDVETEI